MLFNKFLTFFKKNNISKEFTFGVKKKERILNKVVDFTGVKPQQEVYFLKAFTHRSYLDLVKENIKSNERLEFLGDSILGKITADFLFHKYPQGDEGFLTKSRSHIVNKHSLEKIGFNLKLQDLILVNDKYLSADQNKMGNIVADALEALIAAIYLDMGEEVAKKFISEYIIIPQIENGNIKDDKNYKGQLLEYSHANKMEQPVYSIIDQLGPQHDKTYTIKVSVNEEIFGIGTGPNKKTAEQEAAKNALSLIENQNVNLK